MLGAWTAIITIILAVILKEFTPIRMTRAYGFAYMCSRNVHERTAETSLMDPLAFQIELRHIGIRPEGVSLGGTCGDKCCKEWLGFSRYRRQAGSAVEYGEPEDCPFARRTDIAIHREPILFGKAPGRLGDPISCEGVSSGPCSYRLANGF